MYSQAKAQLEKDKLHPEMMQQKQQMQTPNEKLVDAQTAIAKALADYEQLKTLDASATALGLVHTQLSSIATIILGLQSEMNECMATVSLAVSNKKLENEALQKINTILDRYL